MKLTEMLLNRRRLLHYSIPAGIVGAGLATSGFSTATITNSSPATLSDLDVEVDFRKVTKNSLVRPNTGVANSIVATYVGYPYAIPPNTRVAFRITNLPTNLYIANAWASEGTTAPFFGGATITTFSVQADPDNQQIRIVFTHDWGAPLLCGAQVFIGYH